MTTRENRYENVDADDLKTLGNASRSRRGLGQSTIMSVMRRSPIGPFSPAVIGLVAGVLILATLYVGWIVRERSRQGIRASLETVLAANVSALELWLNQQADSARRLAADSEVRRRAMEQFESGNVDPMVVSSAETSQLNQSGYLGWLLVDPLGLVVASSEERYQEATVPLTQALIEKLASGRAVVSRPLRLQLSAASTDTQDDAGTKMSRALMCALAPIRTDGAGRVAVALLIDPGKQFTEILSVARIGNSGETYAVDQDARLLSRSRFENQLRNARLLEAQMQSPLHIAVRDPGVDLRSNPLPASEPNTWPMTVMADDLTRGGRGADVIGYRDYRGVSVVGAWQWLADYEFGVATEQDVDEAFLPIRILRNSFLALLVMVLLAAGVLLVLAWVTRPSNEDGGRLAELSRRLGHYDLKQRIGRGGMGTVFLGAHGLLDRTVAIKVLENADATQRSLARFQREVQLTAKLNHPNTIEIYDFGRTEEGTFFYVMEFVDGISLEQLVDYYGRQPAERVIYLLLQICGSIAEAHAAGMVHRDIKPANVLLTSRSGLHDLIKVLDFGLAKQIDHESIQLTRVDSLTGTPLYMSPESIRDASSADMLSDIYSIAAVGYTLLAGVPPFDGENSADVCAKKLHEEARWPSQKVNAALPDDLQEVLMEALRLDPSARPASVEELAIRLHQCSDAPSWGQQDAALWWDQVFDGPYLDDFEVGASNASERESKSGTQHDTAVNEKRPVGA